MRWPTSISASRGMNWSEAVALLSPASTARWRVASTSTGTRELRSVTSRMREARRPTSTTRPTSPAPVIAAWPRSTPSPAPALTSRVRTKALPESPITRAEMKAGRDSRRRLSKPRSAAFSCSSRRAASSQRRSRSTARKSSAFSSRSASSPSTSATTRLADSTGRESASSTGAAASTTAPRSPLTASGSILPTIIRVAADASSTRKLNLVSSAFTGTATRLMLPGGRRCIAAFLLALPGHDWRANRDHRRRHGLSMHCAARA